MHMSEVNIHKKPDVQKTETHRQDEKQRLDRLELKRQEEKRVEEQHDPAKVADHQQDKGKHWQVYADKTEHIEAPKLELKKKEEEKAEEAKRVIIAEELRRTLFNNVKC
jgi:hypothetical protein